MPRFKTSFSRRSCDFFFFIKGNGSVEISHSNVAVAPPVGRMLSDVILLCSVDCAYIIDQQETLSVQYFGHVDESGTEALSCFRNATSLSLVTSLFSFLRENSSFLSSSNNEKENQPKSMHSNVQSKQRQHNLHAVNSY